MIAKYGATKAQLKLIHPEASVQNYFASFYKDVRFYIPTCIELLVPTNNTAITM
jgi:hypothetical protein